MSLFTIVVFALARPGARWLCRLVISRRLWGLFGLSVVVVFACGCSGCRWESLLHAMGLVGFIIVVALACARPGRRWADPLSLGSLAFALQVVAFIRGRWVRSRDPI